MFNILRSVKTRLNIRFYKVVTQDFGHTIVYVTVFMLLLLLRMFIGKFVQLFHVSTVIITLQLSNPSPALEVTFLKITAFNKIKG